MPLVPGGLVFLQEIAGPTSCLLMCILKPHHLEILQYSKHTVSDALIQSQTWVSSPFPHLSSSTHCSMASASPHEPHLPGFPPVSLVTSWAPFAGSSAHPVNLNVLQNFILDLRFFTLLAVFLHDFILSFNCHPYVEDPYL